MSSLLDKAILTGLCLAIVFTALAHGAVEPWSVAIFDLVVTLLILLWAAKAIIDKRLTLKLPRTIWPLVALLLLGAVQSIAFTDSAGYRKSLSMDVESTRSGAITLFALVICFLVASNFLATRKRLRIFARFLVLFGFGMAIFAMVQELTWNGNFYWLRPNSEGASPFGPFVNHNNFAGYMELIIPVAIALAASSAVSTEARLFYGFAAAVMGVATVASLSRGGMISLGAGILFMIAMLVLSRIRANRSVDDEDETRTSFGMRTGLIVGAIVVTMVGGALWIGSDTIINRIADSVVGSVGDTGKPASAGAETAGNSQETFQTSRGWLWSDAVQMIKAKPLLGVGLGAYETAYPIYGLSDGSYLVGRAHNDYLQVTAEFGIPGALVASWFIFVVWQSLASALASRDRFLSALAIGTGASIFAMMVHSVFDFNLEVPSNALLFLVITALLSLIGTKLVREKKRLRVKPVNPAGVPDSVAGAPVAGVLGGV